MSAFAIRFWRFGFARKGVTPDLGCWVRVVGRLYWLVPYPPELRKSE